MRSGRRLGESVTALERRFDGQALSARAACRVMRTIRTWLAFRREWRGLSLYQVARGWS